MGSIAIAGITTKVDHQIGWAQYTPTVLDIGTYASTHKDQPGTRLMYISEDDGNDATGELYFWDGTQIVDSAGSAVDGSSNAYGTDPMNPSAFIKPYSRWSYVAPRQSATLDIGTTWNGTVGGNPNAPGAVKAEFRYNFPDWWLFKRGESKDLHADFLSFAQETDPGVSTVTQVSLAISGGGSKIGRQVVGAYGPLSLPRPSFTNAPGGVYIGRWGDPEPKNLSYLSLHFDSDGAYDDSDISFLFQTVASRDVEFDDCWFDGIRTAFTSTHMELTFRRCLFADSVGFLWGGERDSIVRWEECILMRCGFPLDPKVTWPPSGAQLFDVRERNLYVSGECDNMASGIFDSLSLYGASGDQFRCGLQIERNFFYQGYVSLGAHGGYPRIDGPSGSMLDNVVQNFKGSGTDNNAGQPGWGIELTAGSYQVEMAYNIMTGGDHVMSSAALRTSSASWYTSGIPFLNPTEANNIHDNIFDSVGFTSAMTALDGVANVDLVESQWSDPGLVNNLLVDNVLINASSVDYVYSREESAVDAGSTDDTTVTGNSVYATRAAAAAALGWIGEDRTLATYMVSLGFSVASDGYDEFYAEAIQQRKGYWRSAFTGKPLLNYVREGFGMGAT